MLVLDLEGLFEKGNEIEETDRFRLVNLTKMLAYLFSWFICHIDEEINKQATDKYLGKVCFVHVHVTKTRIRFDVGVSKAIPRK